MIVSLPYNKRNIDIKVPDNTVVYNTVYPKTRYDAGEIVLKSVNAPVNCLPLSEKLKKSGAKSVVVVVSDITRPIPYVSFLGSVLKEIETAAIARNNICILIATGMHRPSTPAEQEHMFGTEICREYRIVDHRADEKDELVKLDGVSYAGRPIELNRHFTEAGFRITTGLVEPHFMAGFSGGRKAICPGLCSLETVKAFHSYPFLKNPHAVNGNLKENPLHLESLSIARQARVDFCINLIVNKEHKVVKAISGDMEASHKTACDFVKKFACPAVETEVDVVLTSCGGYPLDATFYQCVKGMVSSLPVVKKGGTIIAIGGCSEGIGGIEYQKMMLEYSDRWLEFLINIQKDKDTKRDQWQFQMQTKVLQHVGKDDLIFITNGISTTDVNKLNINGINLPEKKVQSKVRELISRFIREGSTLAVIPEGPYCAPVLQVANRFNV